MCRQHHAAFVSSSSKNARVASSIFSSTSKSSSGDDEDDVRTTTTTTTRANGAGDVAREIVEDIKRKIEENKNEIAQKEMKYCRRRAFPDHPSFSHRTGKFGFVENGNHELEASMIGWWSLLFVELVAGKDFWKC